MTRLTIALAVGIVAATVLSGPAAKLFGSTTIIGHARVIDGDTIEIGARIRLWGMDSPEMGQQCGGQDCGRLAADYLAGEVRGGPVTCTAVDTDRYRRIVATCTASGRDIGETMVRAGYAVDYPFYSQGRYRAAEDEARAARRGLWAVGGFENPAKWRKERR